MQIRLAQVSDAEQILEIYAPYVEKTAITFETTVPTVREMAQRISMVLEHHPWIVIEKDREILAYAYATKHRERAAYRWSADLSVYVKEEFHGKGFGKALYAVLLELLKYQGYHNIYAGICLPNEASVGLHESFGFKKVAHYHQVGYKMGAWHDVGWWELPLLEHLPNPSEPIPIKEVEESCLLKAFQLGTRLLLK